MSRAAYTADLSSNLYSVEYNDNTKVMKITFKQGYAIYDYFDVPSEIMDEMITTKEPGKLFLKRIKDKFECKKSS